MMQEKATVILITGSSRGIGFSLVKLLAPLNFKIYATVRDIRTSKSLCSLASEHKNITIKELDLNELESIHRVTKEIKKVEESIDVIINNASTICFGPVETIDNRQLHKQFQTNLFGPICLIQEILPIMRKNQKGHIVFLGSTSGIESHGMYGAYASSKFALEAIAHSLAVNLDPWKIKVSVVELNATKTSIAKDSLVMGHRFRETDNPYFEYTSRSLKFLQSLLENGNSPDVIANAILNCILNPPNELRIFATKEAERVFESLSTDPANRRWKIELNEKL